MKRPLIRLKARVMKLEVPHRSSVRLARGSNRSGLGTTRTQRWSWQKIADHLGVSKQAVHGSMRVAECWDGDGRDIRSRLTTQARKLVLGQEEAESPRLLRGFRTEHLLLGLLHQKGTQRSRSLSG